MRLRDDVRWWKFRGWLANWIAPTSVFINKDSRFIGASHWGNLKIVEVDDWRTYDREVPPREVETDDV